MTIEVSRFDKAAEAYAYLERLASRGPYVFRGHPAEQYRLKTTLARCGGLASMIQLDDLIDRFRAGLVRAGVPAFESERRLDWLEYARHHGVPTPVLDLTYSPYVALFFAFNGTDSRSGESDYRAVYALNLAQVALAWAVAGRSAAGDRESVERRRREFLHPRDDLFSDGYPNRHLQLIPQPGLWNGRMHRQQGCLLYDTLDADVESLLEDHDETTAPPSKGIGRSDGPVAYKVCVHAKCAHDVFSRLELMGVSGALLFNNADGVALDVRNSMQFHSRVSYVRGLRFPRAR